MYTWYKKYKDNIPNIKKSIEGLSKEEHPNKLLNIYMIPKFKTKNSKFYNLYANSGERLDLTDIISYEKPKVNISKEMLTQTKDKLSFTDIKKGISK